MENGVPLESDQMTRDRLLTRNPPEVRKADLQIMQAAIAAYTRIECGEHTSGWLKIGRGFNSLQASAMRAVGTNQPTGRTYNRCWSFDAHRQGIEHPVASVARLIRALQKRAGVDKRQIEAKVKGERR